MNLQDTISFRVDSFIWRTKVKKNHSCSRFVLSLLLWQDKTLAKQNVENPRNASRENNDNNKNIK